MPGGCPCATDRWEAAARRELPQPSDRGFQPLDGLWTVVVGFRGLGAANAMVVGCFFIFCEDCGVLLVLGP